MEFDFGGYATKNDTLCADGRIIRKHAFAAQNGTKVPLVWMHQRNDPENVLGHAYLEDRDDGVYCHCKFNSSPRGKQAKLLVEHGDISSLSIFANQLVQKGSNVTHGLIREVSLVIAPANPGALIDNPIVQHGDGEEYEDLTRATITSGCDLDLHTEYDIEHGDEDEDLEAAGNEEGEIEDDSPENENDEEAEEDVKDDQVEHADTNTKPSKKEESNNDDRTVQDVYDEMTDEQKKVVAFIVSAALSEKEEDDEAEQGDSEGEDFMPRNVFDQTKSMEMSDTTISLSHDQLSCIFEDAQKCGSLKESFLAHAQEYGIENIDVLFPDAKTVGDNPYMYKRNTEWVQTVMNETTHVPFSRIKSVIADLTPDEARAKGYVKGNLKKEEIVKLMKRVTTPTTVYKKQKLDRDDVLDITELNVVAWLKAEMRVMLDEEVAGAALVSDGREIDDPDKIDEDHIRPISKDDDMYAYHIVLPANTADEDLPDEILRAQEEYKGSGNPKFFASGNVVLKMLLLKDKIGRRLYNTETELASGINVSGIVKVPVMDRHVREVNGKKLKLLGIIVNLRDYTFGAVRGGEVGMFDDFDIDYNQYKYLMETRCCGALTVPHSAIVIEQEIAEGISTIPGGGSSDLG